MTSMLALDDLWDHDDPAASEARFHSAIEAAALLGADAWLAEHEPDRIARLRRLARG